MRHGTAVKKKKSSTITHRFWRIYYGHCCCTWPRYSDIPGRKSVDGCASFECYCRLTASLNLTAPLRRTNEINGRRHLFPALITNYYNAIHSASSTPQQHFSLNNFFIHQVAVIRLRSARDRPSPISLIWRFFFKRKRSRLLPPDGAAVVSQNLTLASFAPK